MQVDVIKRIDKAFNDDDKTFVIVNAPTGTGKSFIAKTLGNAANNKSSDFIDLINSYKAFRRDQSGGYQYYDECMEQPDGGACVLTTTKSLQDQYNNLFEDIETLKGMSNYQCQVNLDYSVDVAPCIHTPKLRSECWACNSCPYYSQRNISLTSNLGAFNYDMFMALPEHVKRHQYIICDEASELEDQIIKSFSCQINIKILRKIYGIDFSPLPSQYDKLGRWVTSVALQCKDIIIELRETLAKTKDKGVSYGKIQKKYLSILNLYSELRRMVNTWSSCEYVLEKGGEFITFKPLKVDKLASYIFSHGVKVVLMSATIIDPLRFAKNLGICTDDYEYIEVESPFDPKRAPIYCSSDIKLSYRNLQSSLPKIVKQIQSICNAHGEEKGIIHTHTNLITETVKNGLKGDRFLVREPGITNEMLLRDHSKEGVNSVLVSPSMSFGVDLKDDLARFQIIIKAPFLPINEERTKRMINVDSDWYMNKMLISLIQSCGRGIRSANDHCTTYILDANITSNVIKNKSRLPKYFINRIV